MTTPPAKKACDACHRRKVRCSGGQPCKNCGQASLQCTYLAIPQKKGPKGSRAKVISEIRDKQNVELPSPRGTTNNYDAEHEGFDFNRSPLSPGTTRHPDLLTGQIIDSCVVFYFSHLYATLPILSQVRLGELIKSQLATSLEVYCLIGALCAFILVQPGMTLEGSKSIDGNEALQRMQHASQLLREVTRIRKSLDYAEAPTLHAVQTSLFMFGSYFGLDKGNQAYFSLREASTLAQLLLMHEESSYHTGDAADNMYKRRTYWLILATERAYAMERHRPLSLYATIELPSVDEEPQEAMIMSGFLYLVNLYRLIDEEFMAIWNKAKSGCSTTWLAHLQQQLADSLPSELECTPNQAADVLTTQHWLRTMVWQLSITNGYLSSSSKELSMTFRYPIQIAKDLVRDVQKLTQPSLEVHGPGLIEKLFDIACTLTDVIACVPPEQEPAISSESPSDHLNQLLNIISTLRGGASKYQPLLVAKVSENLPSLVPYSKSGAESQSLHAQSQSQSQSPRPTSAHNLTASVRSVSASPFRPGSVFETARSRSSHGVSDTAMTPLTSPVSNSTSAAFGHVHAIVAAHPRKRSTAGVPHDQFRFDDFKG